MGPTVKDQITALFKGHGGSNANPAGRALWASQHDGNPAGYDSASAAVKENWDNVARNGA